MYFSGLLARPEPVIFFEPFARPKPFVFFEPANKERREKEEAEEHPSLSPIVCPKGLLPLREGLFAGVNGALPARQGMVHRHWFGSDRSIVGG